MIMKDLSKIVLIARVNFGLLELAVRSLIPTNALEQQSTVDSNLDQNFNHSHCEDQLHKLDDVSPRTM
jgi:hypothetical protein